MRIFKHFVTFFSVLLLLITTGCDQGAVVRTDSSNIDTNANIGSDGVSSDSSGYIPNQYIVVFKNIDHGKISSRVADKVDQITNSVMEKNGISEENIMNRYKYSIHGFTAKLNQSQLEALKRDSRVDHITQDHIFDYNPLSEVSANSAKINTTSSGSQIIPWGITKVNGPLDGTGKRAWIIDTGVDLDNSDLNVDVTNSISFVQGESPNDLIGHGTHVAGILAAKNNSIGVVGVAAGATVVAVKVLHVDSYQNKYSEIIEGIDYVAGKASPGDIVNVSLGDPSPDNSDVDNAVINAANNGIRFVIAAGNESQSANNVTPARVEHSNVWTVSAFDSSNIFASFSNFDNPPIEYSSPGVNIESLAIGSGTTVKSGTSMSAPHIAGLLLASNFGTQTDGHVNNDPDGNSDPILVARLVKISGPNTLSTGEQGTWTASVVGNSNDYSYEWYFKSDDTNDQWDGPVGNNSTTYSTTMYSFDGYLDIKVVVSDGLGRTDDSVQHVYCPDCQIGGGGGPLSTE